MDAEETDSAFVRNTDHEELVVLSGLNLADRLVLIRSAFLSILHGPHFFLIKHVDIDLVVTSQHQECIVVLDVIERVELGDSDVGVDRLERLPCILAISDVERVDFASVRSNHEYSGVFVECTSGDVLIFILQLVLELDLKAA